MIDDRDIGRLRETIRCALDPMVALRRIVDEAVQMIPDARGAAIELLDAGRLRSIYTHGLLAARDDSGNTARTGLATIAMATGSTQRCDDARHDARADRAQCEVLGIRSLLCVPLRSHGETLGVLKVCSPDVAAFAEHDVQMLDELAEFVACVISSTAELSSTTDRLLTVFNDDRESTPGAVEKFIANVIAPGIVDERDSRDRIERVIAERRYDIVVQPIVDLTTRKPVGYEALTRFHGADSSPDVGLADAHQLDLGPELELEVARAALSLRGSLPSGTYLAINVGADLLADERLIELVDGPLDQIVFEVTEQHPIADYPSALEMIDRLRRAGARIAVDDTGAGFASLSHLLSFRPDIVKLDRELTVRIDTDSARQALATALVEFCGATGATLVAEGIENAAQLRTLRDLGVDHGQGFHIARPAPTAVYFPPTPISNRHNGSRWRPRWKRGTPDRCQNPARR